MNKKLGLVLLILILGSFSLLVGGSFLYLMLFVLLTIIVYSYFSVKKSGQGLVGVFWVDDKVVEKGDIIDLNYKVYNSSVIPIPYGEVEFDIPNKLTLLDNRKKVYFVRPFEYLRLNNKVKCNHRGIYEIGSIKVLTGDVFGLLKSKIYVKDSVSLTIYPKVYKLDNLNLDGNEYFGFTPTNQKLNEDYSSLKDIRKYQRGDSVKRVDWKTTARRGEVFVKNYDVSINIQVKLFMDFQVSKYENDIDELIEEKVVECAISIIHHSLYNKTKTDFITYGDKKIEISARDISRFNEFLDLVTRFKPIKEINLGEVILNESRGFAPGTTVVIVTPEVDNRLLSSLFILKKSGYVVVVIIVGNFGKDRSLGENAMLLEKSGVKIYLVDLDDNITQVLR